MTTQTQIEERFECKQVEDYSSKVKEQQEIVLLVTGDTEEEMLANFEAIINHPKVVSAYEAREENNREH